MQKLTGEVLEQGWPNLLNVRATNDKAPDV